MHNDHKQILPCRDLGQMRIASLVIGDTLDNAFQHGLKRYADVKTFRYDRAMKRDSLTALLRKLEDFDRVIVSVHNTSWRVNKDFGIPETAMDIVREIAARKPTVFALFANPYRLTRAYGAHYLASVITAYEETPETQDLVSQVIFGGLGANGRLPITASSFFMAGDGIDLRPIGRFGYTLPESIGIRSSDLNGIDAIVEAGIKANAYPGCEVLVAVDGQVIFKRAVQGMVTVAARVLTDAGVTPDQIDLVVPHQANLHCCRINNRFFCCLYEDRAASKSEWDISLPQNQSKESDVSLDLSSNNISITPVANGPYPQPQLAFGKIDFLRMLNEIGFDDHWKKEFANYLSTPQLFWSECTASESSRAQMQGGMNQAEAPAHAIESCQSTTEIYYECLNSKKLDDAAMCLQQHISNVAENGD